MDSILLEEFKLNEPALFYRLENELSLNDKWRNVVSALSTSRKPLFFRSYILRKMELSSKPADFLLNELIARQFTLSYFKEILRNCNEFTVLANISQPEPLEITVQPGDDNSEQTVNFGEEFNLECRASGMPLPNYQWYHNNTPIPNATNSTLIIPYFESANEGSYRCSVSHIVKSNLEILQSHTVICKLLVMLPEFVYQSPQDITKYVGSNVTLSVCVKSNSQYNVQWIKDNALLKDGKNLELEVKNLTLRDSGKYWCMATNAAGEKFAKPVTLKVINRVTKLPSAKIALLIGNEKYENHNELLTPCNDIILLAEKLKILKYHVIALMNLTLLEMHNVINWFFDILPPGADAVFVFVGHGFQLLKYNFMVPVDSPDMTKCKMTDCICDELLVKKAKNKKLQLFLLILDMCLREPNSKENPEIFNERADDYTYEPCSDCNVFRIFSTSNHQSAYEIPEHKHGIYIEHISKYLLHDKPIIKIFNTAHDDFGKRKVVEKQKPTISYDGGHRLTLNVNPLSNKEIDEKIKAITCLKPVHMLKFKKLDIEARVLLTPHRNTILNAIDINFVEEMQCEMQIDISPEVCVMGINGRTITLFNLQKVKNDVYITVRTLNSEEEDSDSLDLGKPLIGGAYLWYQPVLENESI